jgi:phosphomannomutase/phosphoglucomutase
MPTLDPHIFRAYDIRGKANTQLTEEACLLIGKGFGTVLRELYKIDHPKVVLGRDARTHSPAFEEAMKKGLMSTGCHVLLIGQTPSPVNYFTICDQKLDGGIQITASHNPKDDNGIKLQVRDAEAHSGEDLQRLRERIEKEDFVTGEGTEEVIDGITPYIEALEKLFSGVGAGKTVVVDSGNGVAGPVYTEVLKRVGCTVHGLFIEPDGEFPNHPADPSKRDTLKDLQKEVVEKKAFLGFAFDGDGDRMGLVDENGRICSADEILLLLAKDHLSRHAGAPVIFTVSNSGTLETEIQKWGGKPVMCKVGHSFVEHAMRENNALLGGEQSGHFFCGENYYSYDDALVASLNVLKSLGSTPLSEAVKEFPQVFQADEKRPHCPDSEKSRVIQEVTESFSKNYPVITLDGVRVDFGDGAWAGIRQSNTSPCLSICIEARSEEKLKEVEEIVWSEMKKYPEVEL